MTHFFQIAPFFVILIFLGLHGYGQIFTSLKFKLLERTPFVKFTDSNEETISHFLIEGSINGGGNFEKIWGIPNTVLNGDKDLFLSVAPFYNQIRPLATSKN